MNTFNHDLLYEIAEKLLCSGGEYSVNLPNAARFMFINKGCKHAFLDQFSKMKCADIFFTYKSSDALFKGMEVNLYKDKNYMERGFDAAYKGPYVINAAFAGLLMQYDRFHPRNIKISDAFSTHRELALTQPSQIGTPIQCLATILNLGYFDAPYDSYSFYSVHIHETKGYLVDLGLVLALNAKETTLELQINGYHCAMKYAKDLKFTADHIKTLSITFNSQWESETDDNESFAEFPHEEWTDLLGAIFSSCPALKKLNVRVNFSDFYDGCLNLLALRLQKSIDSITKRVLPEVYKNTPPPVNSNVEIEFCAFLNFLVIQDIPVDEYELFKFGEAEPADEGEVVRAAKFDRNTLKIIDGSFVSVKNMMGKATGDAESEAEKVEPGCVIRFAIYRFVDEDSDVERQMLEDVLDYSGGEDFDVDDDVIDYYEHDLDDVEEY